MAPEMLQRRGDHRSDIYSLGVMLFECLTGDVPFRGDSEWEVLRKHETEPPAFPPHLGEVERRVLSRCLAKDPVDRYESAAELLHDLQAPAALGESMVLPRHRSAPAPAARPEGAVRGQRVAPPTASPPPSSHRPTRRASAQGPISGLVHLVFRLFEFVFYVMLHSSFRSKRKSPRFVVG